MSRYDRVRKMQLEQMKKEVVDETYGQLKEQIGVVWGALEVVLQKHS